MNIRAHLSYLEKVADDRNTDDDDEEEEKRVLRDAAELASEGEGLARGGVVQRQCPRCQHRWEDAGEKDNGGKERPPLATVLARRGDRRKLRRIFDRNHEREG